MSRTVPLLGSQRLPKEMPVAATKTVDQCALLASTKGWRLKMRLKILLQECCVNSVRNCDFFCDAEDAKEVELART